MYPATRRILRTWAADAVAQALAVAAIDPSWGTEVRAIADGWLVLSGPGFPLNRGVGVGIDADVGDSDLEAIIDRSRALRVQPAVEVSPLTRSSLEDRLQSFGFVHDATNDVVTLVRPVPGPEVVAPDDVVVEPVRSVDDLERWQVVSAATWGHTEPAARRASDDFARAAHAIDGDGMMIAVDADGRAIGCASVTITDRVATLGGMSTHPDHRRRGVQAALIARRRQLAVARGCDLLTSTAVAGSSSERNLVRHGFEPIGVISTWSLPEPSVG